MTVDFLKRTGQRKVLVQKTGVFLDCARFVTFLTICQEHASGVFELQGRPCNLMRALECEFSLDTLRTGAGFGQ